jgi:hypothetical protein
VGRHHRHHTPDEPLHAALNDPLHNHTSHAEIDGSTLPDDIHLEQRPPKQQPP